MSIFTRNPTANQTPDATLGGIAVTGIINTGHFTTTATASVNVTNGSDSDSETKSARWFTFVSDLGVTILDVRLKFDWSISGNAAASATPGGSAEASATSTISYSINNGGSWTDFVTGTAGDPGSPTSYSSSGAADIALSLTQDITQVQVRDLMTAAANATDIGGVGSSAASASAIIIISNIRLEITIQDGGVIVIM